MTTTTWDLTFDCHSPAVVAAFWKVALGYNDAPPPAGFDSWLDWFTKLGVPEDEWDDGATITDPEGIRPMITFLKVPEGKVAKNRIHLDLKVSGGRAEPPALRTERITATVETLLANGATIFERTPVDGVLDHVVMQDPEGNEFCVV